MITSSVRLRPCLPFIMNYIIHQKSFYDKGIVKLLAVSDSKEIAFEFVEKNYPDYHRDDSQDGPSEWFFRNKSMGIWVEKVEEIKILK